MEEVNEMEHFGSIMMEPPAEYDTGRSSSREFAIVLKRRTKSAAVELINFMERTGKSPALNVVRYQIIKSATSVAANYRAACRARSKKEWYAKLCIVVEECDETVFWLELLMESDLSVDQTQVRTLGKEYQTLLQLFAKARANAKFLK